MERMEGVIQPYAWGSPSFIPTLLGLEASGDPQAELWLGAHPSAPSTVGGRSLDELIADDADGVLGSASTEAFGPRLPYLLKVLAAAKPLSLQAHPSRKQAEEGYAREQAEGIPADASHRLFKDDWPKPELLCALTCAETLSGFREPDSTYALLEQLGAQAVLELAAPLAQTDRPAAERVEETFGAMMRLGGDEAKGVIDEVLARARAVDADGEVATLAATASELAEHHPSDPGVLAALLMNRVALAPGEAMFLPAGNLHAYLSGAGIEIMANSDNVLRGGLTAKHVDVDELLRVLDFAPGFTGHVTPEPESPGVWRYPTPAPEFALYRVAPDGARAELPADALGRSLVVVEGSLQLAEGERVLPLEKGQAAFVSAGTTVTAEGDGTAFLASAGV
jgi:mannose-6-phosphate isomerase